MDERSFTSVQDNLIAGLEPDIVATEVVVEAGQGLMSRGTLLGRKTADSKCVLCNSGGTDDGRRTAFGILCEDIDATDEDVTTMAYREGAFNENSVVFGGTDTANTHRDALEAKRIYLKAAVSVV